MYILFFKRFFDFWISLIALICITPLLLFVTIWLGFPCPLHKEGRMFHYWIHGWLNRAFFLQERPGKDGKLFRVIKFKTMTDECDENGKLLPDEMRLTKVGRFIRSTSIDELPQLINVLKGDMSLIGPRPLLVQYLPLYTPEQARRHDVRPGISGWAQVHGRNLCKLSKKFEYDAWYVDHLSLGLDLKIVFMTIKNVFKRSDIGKGAANMVEVDDLNFVERIKLN